MARTLVIGDSLQVGTGSHLRKRVRGVEVDARSGRGSREGVKVLRRKLAKRRYGRIVFDLGTNDMDAGELKRSVAAAKRAAGDTPLYVASVRGRDAARKNRVLKRSGVRVVPWAERSGGLVGGDGIHASVGGYRKRARLLARYLDGADTPRAAPRARPSRRGLSYPLSPVVVAPRPDVDLGDLRRRLRGYGQKTAPLRYG